MSTVTRSTTNLKKYKLILEKILGTTSRHNSGVAIHPTSNSIAYIAGSVVVIFSPDEPYGKQYEYLQGPKPKTITCLSFSQNGKYLAAGEAGHLPAILIWELSTRKLVAELKTHKFGVGCIEWSPNSKWLISIGYQRDQFLNVWDWRQQQVVACNKISNKIYSIAIPEDPQYFMTCGTNHLKIWHYADTQGNLKKTDKMYKGRSVLDGRMITLDEKYKDSTFIDVCCTTTKDKSKHLIFAITTSGWLIQVDQTTRRVEKWVNMKTPKAFGLGVSEDIITVGCDNGIVRVFDLSLNYLATLPKPSPLGLEVPCKSSSFATTPKLYADTVACKILNDKRVVTIYSNRSLFMWDTTDLKKVSLSYSFLGHSACIWDIATGSESTFVTASADSTIRFWNVASKPDWKPRYDCNIFSQEMTHCIPVLNDPLDLSVSGDPYDLETRFIGSGGIRCIALSPDHEHVASGDRQGNLRVHELRNFTEVCSLVAHETEITTLEYSYATNGDPKLLASGSRDRLIHVFQRMNEKNSEPYVFRTTVDDHTSSVVSLHFTESGECTKLVSCGSDKTILFRNIQKGDDDNISISRYHREMVSGITCDMEIDPEGKELIIVGGDKKLPVWNIQSGKKTRTIISNDTENKTGKEVKVTFDPSGQFVATSSQDHFIRIYDIEQGNLLACASGHSELITGIKFLHDYVHLVSISGDGCIFIWKLPSEISVAISRKIEVSRDNIPRERALSQKETNSGSKFISLNTNIPSNNEHHLDIQQLPPWAIRAYLKLHGENSIVEKVSEGESKRKRLSQNPPIQRKWFRDIENIRTLLSQSVTKSRVKTEPKDSEEPVYSVVVTRENDENINLSPEFSSGDGKENLKIGENFTEEDCMNSSITEESFTNYSEEPLFEDFENFPDFVPQSNFNNSRLSLSARFLGKKNPVRIARENSSGEQQSISYSFEQSPILPELKNELSQKLDISIQQQQNSEGNKAQHHEKTLRRSKSLPAETPNKMRKENSQNSSTAFSQWELDLQKSRQRLYELGIFSDSIPFSAISNSVVEDFECSDERSFSDDLESGVMDVNALRYHKSMDSPMKNHLPKSTMGDLISEVDYLDEIEPINFDDVSPTKNDTEIKNLTTFLNNLKMVFDQSVSLYRNISNSNHKNSEEALSQFQKLFAHMKVNIDEISMEQTEITNMQKDLLERYSKMLVDVVCQKLSEI